MACFKVCTSQWNVAVGSDTSKLLIFNTKKPYVMVCAIWYHLYNLKNVKNTHEEVLLLVKLQALACNFTKSNTSPWVFFTFFKLHKWYQTVQSVSYRGTSIDTMQR